MIQRSLEKQNLFGRTKLTAALLFFVFSTSSSSIDYDVLIWLWLFVGVRLLYFFKDSNSYLIFLVNEIELLGR